MQHCIVVDDSGIIRQAARLIFESLGFRVSEAENVREALERISDPADLIVIDWQIPGDNVHDFIATVRQASPQMQPFILYLLTEIDPDDLARAFKAGADDYLLKPFNREIIEMKLHQIRVAA